MPPDMKKMSDRYKEMYSCVTCLKMKMCQESLVRFRKGVLQQLKRAHDDRAKYSSSARRRIANQVQKYETEITFHEDRELDGPYFDGLYHISCAYGWCTNCLMTNV